MSIESRTVAAAFRMPDSIWNRIEGLLPRFRKSKKGGRPRLEWRQILDGIFYVLRTGCQWKALPPEFGSGSSAHRYFQLLVQRGIFRDIWMASLEEYDDLHGLEWKWQSMDGAMTKSPLGGEKNRTQSHRSRQARDETQSADRGERPADWARRLRRQYPRQEARRRDPREYAAGTATGR
jgi:putative transposase